jgi:hypothetical protein
LFSAASLRACSLSQIRYFAKRIFTQYVHEGSYRMKNSYGFQSSAAEDRGDTDTSRNDIHSICPRGIISMKNSYSFQTSQDPSN